MWKKKEKPIRLEKQVSRTEKFQNWINKHRQPLIIIGVIIALIIFVLLIMKFAPGTESGLFYNNRTRVV